MKRAWPILVAGILLALLAYAAAYHLGSGRIRAMEASPAPELAWLQSEFHIPPAEFDRICKLHQAYMGGCAERCQRIDAKNAELKALLSATNAVTPAIEQTMRDAALLRVDCQKAMLEHFYEVSRTMPPEQGKRYFDWVVGSTFGSAHALMVPQSRPAVHEHHPE